MYDLGAAGLELYMLEYFVLGIVVNQETATSAEWKVRVVVGKFEDKGKV